MAQQSYKKFVASAATATLVASAIVPVASANVTTSAFTDVPASYKEAVDFVVSNNIAAGKTETQFGISQQILRGDAAIMIAAAAGLNDKDAPAAGFSDVPTRGALAVNSLKAAGVISGKTATKFGFNENITRGEAALMLQKAFKLKAGDKKNNFTDVSDRYDDAVDALVANNVTNGINKTQFGTMNNIKRGDFAKFLFALEEYINIEKLEVASLKANSTTSFDVVLEKAVSADADVASLLKVKVVLEDGTVVMPKATDVKVSEDRKTITVEHKENDLDGLTGTLSVNGKDLAFDYNTVATVESVKAINEKTLTVTGAGLKNLKVEDVTVDGNTVASVSASADGKFATVTLVSSLVPAQDTKVSIKDSEKIKEFSVKFEVSATKVELLETTLDDNLQGQSLKFKVNGQETTAEYLALAGYSVNFVAVEKTTSGVDLFTGGKTSTTGKDINVANLKGLETDYDVEIQLLKSGVATISDSAVIKVRNIESVATTIDSVKFALDADNTGASAQQYFAGAVNLTGTDFILNSQKVVAGEKFYVANAVVTKSGEKQSAAKTAVSVKSSNPAVLSVATTAGSTVVTAEGAGTATLTVSVGDVKKEYSFTVSNDVRKLSSVKVASGSLTVVKGKSNSVKLETLDQYGDPVAVVSGNAGGTVAIDEVVPTTAGGTALVTSTDVVTSGTPNSVGVVNYTLTGNAAGTGTLFFKDVNTQKVLGSIVLKVTEVDNVTSQKLEIVAKSGYSDNNSLELTDDNKVRYSLKNYTSEGVYNGLVDLGAAANVHTVTVVDPTIVSIDTLNGDSVLDSGETHFDVVALKAGTTDVLLKDANGVIVGKQTITVTKNAFKVNSISWKSVPTINFEGKVLALSDVVTITPSVDDDIVTGITLNKSTSHKVRIDATDELYVDVDGNGTYSLAGDGEKLGKFTATVATGAVGANLAGDLASAVTGTSATASGDKATVIFKFSVDADASTTYEPNEVISSTSVSIDVK